MFDGRRVSQILFPSKTVCDRAVTFHLCYLVCILINSCASFECFELVAMCYACKDILIKLLKSYCAHMYGCELWNIYQKQKAFRELCVAYHSCVKKLTSVPVWTRNHELCHQLKLLPCPMLVAKRQLIFQHGITVSENSIICSLRNSDIGRGGIVARTHTQIRQLYGLLNMDFNLVTRNDLTNIFVSHLERVIRGRAVQRQQQDQDP